MIEQSVIESLFGAVEDGRWERIVGAALVALVALVRFLSSDRFSTAVGEWISAVSALLGGVGAAFLAGAAWWHALIIGLLVLPSSRGFWERVRGMLPERHEEQPQSGPVSVEVGPDDDEPRHPVGSAGPLAAVALLLCIGALTACGGRQCPAPTEEQVRDAARYVVPYLEDAVEGALDDEESE